MSEERGSGKSALCDVTKGLIFSYEVECCKMWPLKMETLYKTCFQLNSAGPSLSHDHLLWLPTHTCRFNLICVVW